MGVRSSAALRAFRHAQLASAYARQEGCAIGEATEMLAQRAAEAGADARLTPSGTVSRRQLLRGSAAAAALAAAVRHGPGAPDPSGQAGKAGAREPRVVIVGSGIAGLGCAYRLSARYGIRSEVYEYNARRPGGRIETLRGFFADGQYTEQHGEFISSEHTRVRQLAAAFGLTLDNVNVYPPHTRPADYRFRFGGRFWPQASLDRDRHEWGYRLFSDAAFIRAPWPTLHDEHTAWAWRWDHMPATEWIQHYIPGGLASDFGRLCEAVLLDEYRGPVADQSALNLIYLLGTYDSVPSGRQRRGRPQLSGSDEKWHVRGGNDQLISGLVGRLPAGVVHLGHRLEAVRSRGHGRYTCTFSCEAGLREVHADHVVLALPVTRLREVELPGIDLPALQRRAIREEPRTNSKIQLQFSSRAWNADHR